MNEEHSIKKAGDFFKNSATVKVFTIGFLVLILLIPASMISSLMRERQNRRDSVIQEINQKWGNAQTIAGPFFTIPYKAYFRDEDNQLRYQIRYLHILPENLDISGDIKPQIRYRSIFEAILYNIKLSIHGSFNIPDLHQLNIEPEHVMWDKAVLSLGISDMRGIQDDIDLIYNEQKYKVHPGLQTADLVSSGIHCEVPLTPTETQQDFSAQLNLNGSEEIHFIPLGETTLLHLKSSWPTPSFNGAFLPNERSISPEGFSASWKVLHLNRNYPQVWKERAHQIYNSAFGVKLLITADIYQKSIRLAKYAILFIVFTFSAFFLTEIINRKRLHPIQYLLIGLAIILFYVLLLAISEQVSFNLAYVLSAAGITVMVTAYSRSIMKNKFFTLTIFGILTVLYSYLFIVLQLEDYALIMGSVGLFLVLGLIMYLTRKVDWYSLDKMDKPDI